MISDSEAIGQYFCAIG